MLNVRLLGFTSCELPTLLQGHNDSVAVYQPKLPFTFSRYFVSAVLFFNYSSLVNATSIPGSV